MPGSSRQFNGACHCGAVRFRVTLTEDIEKARRCSCSICRMRGAVAVSAPLDGIEFLQGEENLTLYRFGTGTARHYFCATCGIYTHHQRRSNPNEFGINVSCLEAVSPFDFTEIPVHDGGNHPSDTGRKSGLLGTLVFKPSSPS